ALEITPQLLLNGLTLWDSPITGKAADHLRDRIEGIFQLPWDAFTPTVGVSQISVSTEPRLLSIAGLPPEITWARVGIFGYGFAPGVPVLTKWNNAFGFPDNGVGNNS